MSNQPNEFTIGVDIGGTFTDIVAVNQKNGIQKSFPKLPEDIIQSFWSGVVSRTRNSSQIFEKLIIMFLLLVVIMVQVLE